MALRYWASPTKRLDSRPIQDTGLFWGRLDSLKYLDILLSSKSLYCGQAMFVKAQMSNPTLKYRAQVIGQAEIRQGIELSR